MANKKHPLKGRKWTEEQKAKAAATRAANRAKKENGSAGAPDVAGALICLREAYGMIIERRPKKPDPIYTRVMLALEALEGA